MEFKRQAYSVKRREKRNPLIRELFAIRYSLDADSRGFTLLLAALVSSITLAIGVSIFEITQKQVILSSLSRDSQYAFYTADTGAECALYWDVKHGYFATSTHSNTLPPLPTCDNQPLHDAVTGTFPVPGSSLPYTMSFQFEPGGLCAKVTVKKNNTDPRTVIHGD